jgi:hypothetical protein
MYLDASFSESLVMIIKRMLEAEIVSRDDAEESDRISYGHTPGGQSAPSFREC